MLLITQAMDPKVMLLLAVTFITLPAAISKCSEGFKCLSRKACTKIHGGRQIKPLPVPCAENGRVCCPTGSAPTPTSSATTPTKYADHIHFSLLPSANICGRASLEKLKAEESNDPEKVLGGRNATDGAYPWMALLFFTHEILPNETEPLCGGSLISARYVLTAAHCFSDKMKLLKYVRLAEFDIREKTCAKKYSCPRNVTFEKIIIHESFNATSLKNDIALIRLKEDVLPTNNLKIAPICLPFAWNTTVGKGSVLQVAGWGTTKAKKKAGSPVLQEVALHATGGCSTCPEGTHALRHCPLSPTEQLCVQVTRKKGACYGDSGGPLMKEVTKGHFVQFGIVSFKPGGCDEIGIPSIYTRIESYLKWILNNIEPAQLASNADARILQTLR